MARFKNKKISLMELDTYAQSQTFKFYSTTKKTVSVHWKLGNF